MSQLENISLHFQGNFASDLLCIFLCCYTFMRKLSKVVRNLQYGPLSFLHPLPQLAPHFLPTVTPYSHASSVSPQRWKQSHVSFHRTGNQQWHHVLIQLTFTLWSSIIFGWCKLLLQIAKFKLTSLYLTMYPSAMKSNELVKSTLVKQNQNA